MSIPKIDIYQDGSLATALGFGARPLGGTSNPIEIVIWNDYPTTKTNEVLGTGDGATATFSLAYENIYSAAPLTVKVAGTTKTEGTHYSVNRATGKITFLAGSIPTAGQEVVASYSYGTGAGAATDVFLLSRRRQTFVSSGSASMTLAAFPTVVYEVMINDVLTTEYTVSDNILTLNSAPTPGDVILVIYEDESCVLQMLQVRSNGTEDPFSQSPVDDAETVYRGIGGHTDITDEAVGTGDGSSLIFPLINPCILEGSLVVKVDGGEDTSAIVDPIRGELEFPEAPGDGLAITATYSCYNIHKISSIPAACARKVQTRGHAATTATQALAEATLEVWAV